MANIKISDLQSGNSELYEELSLEECEKVTGGGWLQSAWNWISKHLSFSADNDSVGITYKGSHDLLGGNKNSPYLGLSKKK